MRRKLSHSRFWVVRRYAGWQRAFLARRALPPHECRGRLFQAIISVRFSDSNGYFAAEMKLKIRYCPCCAELVHFEPEVPVQRCWNCGCVSNFDLIKAPEVRLAQSVWRQMNAALDALISLGVGLSQVMPSSSRMARVGRMSLVVAIPAVVVMLLVTNSFAPYIVHDATAPFTLPELRF